MPHAKSEGLNMRKSSMSDISPSSSFQALPEHFKPSSTRARFEELASTYRSTDDQQGRTLARLDDVAAKESEIVRLIQMAKAGRLPPTDQIVDAMGRLDFAKMRENATTLQGKKVIDRARDMTSAGTKAFEEVNRDDDVQEIIERLDIARRKTADDRKAMARKAKSDTAESADAPAISGKDFMVLAKGVATSADYRRSFVDLFRLLGDIMLSKGPTAADTESLVERMRALAMDMHGSSDMRRSLVLLNALYRLASSRGSDAMDGSTVHLDGHPAKHDLAEAYSHTKSLFSRMGKGYDMAALTGALEEVVAMRGKSSAFARLLDDAGTFGDWAMGVDSGELVSEDFQTRAQKLIDQSRQALSDDERAAIRKLSTETTNYMRVVQDNPVLVEYKDAMVGLAHAITGHGLHGEERADHIDALRRDVLAMLPLLARAVRYVPLPRVAGQNKKLEFAIDNIVLDLKHFVPEHMSFGSHSEVYPRAGLLKDETASRSSHGFNGEQFFTLTIKGIHFVAKRVAFYLKKKKGLPRLADKGIADLVIGDRGMDITIHLRHLHSSEQASESQSPADGASGARRARMFDIADARVELHTLDIQVRENKHTIGGALTLALMRPVARRLIARNISHALMGALADGDRLLARYSSSAQDLVAASGRKALSSAKDAARHGSHKDSKERAPKSRGKAAAAKAASRRDSAVEAPDASATQATT